MDITSLLQKIDCDDSICRLKDMTSQSSEVAMREFGMLLNDAGAVEEALRLMDIEDGDE